MKGKSLLALTIAAATVCCNSFAMEMYKGHIIKHKEWTTKGITAIFNTGKIIPTQSMHNKIGEESNSTFASVRSHLRPAVATVGTMANITSDYQSAYVFNQTQATASYNYVLEICVQLDEKNIQCANSSTTFELEPTGYADFSQDPTIQLTFKKPGTYKTSAYSDIQTTFDLSKAGNYFSNSSEANSVIEVTEAKG